MNDYDILADIIFYSEGKGGRKSLPPIEQKEYTYRPIIRFSSEKNGYCSGIIIGDYIENYKFDVVLKDVKIKFLNRDAVKQHLVINNVFSFDEGFSSIGEGIIKAIQL